MLTLAHSIPMFDDKNVFHREEKEGFHTFIKYGIQENVKIINNTAHKIIELCNGNNSVKDIYSELTKLYPDVPEKLIEKDINETLIIFNNNDFISWKDGENPFQKAEPEFQHKTGEYVVKKYVTEEFKKIHEIIKALFVPDKSEHKLTSSMISPLVRNGALYNEVILRNRIFNRGENFYYLEKDNKLMGVLAIIDEYPVANRGIISFTALMSETNPKDFLEKIFEGINQDLGPKITKLKVSLVSTDSNFEEWSTALTACGFVNEGELKHEYGPEENELIFAKYYV